MNEEERLKNLIAEHGEKNINKNLEYLTAEDNISNNEVFREIGNNIYRVIEFGIKAPFYILFGIHSIPTAARIISRKNDPVLSGIVIGSGIFGTIIESSHLYNLTKNSYIAAIPFATNLASGAYEYYRYTKKKLIENKNSPKRRII